MKLEFIEEIVALKMSQMLMNNDSDHLGYKPSFIIAQAIYDAQPSKGMVEKEEDSKDKMKCVGCDEMIPKFGSYRYCWNCLDTITDKELRVRQEILDEKIPKEGSSTDEIKSEIFKACQLGHRDYTGSDMRGEMNLCSFITDSVFTGVFAKLFAKQDGLNREDAETHAQSIWEHCATTGSIADYLQAKFGTPPSRVPSVEEITSFFLTDGNGHELIDILTPDVICCDCGCGKVNYAEIAQRLSRHIRQLLLKGRG